jgi:hypothetical protein
MPYQLFTYYIENPLVIISINIKRWGWVMVIRLQRETWVIGKGGAKRRGWGMGKRYGGPYVCLGYISTVVVEGDCVRDYRRLGVCTVGTVG